MANNRHDVNIRIAAEDRASKELGQVKRSMNAITDTVSAYGSALDEHKGSIRDFPDVQKRAYQAASAVIKTETDKMLSEKKRLDDASKTNRSAIKDNAAAAKAAKIKRDAASQAVIDIQAEQDALKGIVREHKTTERARVKSIEAEKQPHVDRLKSIDKEIAALARLRAKRMDAHDADLTTVETGLNRAGKPLTERSRNTVMRRIVNYDNDLADIDGRLADSRATYQREAQAQAPILDAIDKRVQSEKDLIKVEKAGHEERKQTLRRDLIDKRALNTEYAKEYRLRMNNVSSLLTDRLANRAARTAVSANIDKVTPLGSMDAPALRTASRGMGDAPGAYARGLAVMTAEATRAASAQKLLTGEIATSGQSYEAASSYMAGLISLYAIYATTVSQAGQVIDAFRAKEAFEITVSNTMGGDMKRAGDDFEYMTMAADKYGYSIAAISQEYAKLASAGRGMGRSEKDIRTMFEGIMSVARVNSLSEENVSNSFRAVVQAMSKGVLNAEELRGQLAESLVGVVVNFAKSQGYGPEEMGKFAKDLEAGKFATKDIVEYAKQEMDANASAVFRAQDTYAAVLAKLQNTLFKARADFAENGFMDGLKDTLRDLDTFFQSDEGRAYMIRLGEGAKMTIGVMETLAKNLDNVVQVIGFLAASKAVVFIGSLASGISALILKIVALSSQMKFLIAAFGGIPALLLAAVAAVWSIASGKNASEAAEAQSRLDRIKNVFGEIGNAAIMAGDDIDDFIKRLKDLPGMTETGQMAMADDLKKARVDILDELDETADKMAAKIGGFDTGVQGMAFGMTRQVMTAFGADMPDVTEDMAADSPAMAEFNRLRGILKGGNYELKEFLKQVDEFSKANPEMLEFAVGLEDTANALQENTEQTELYAETVKAAAGDEEAATEVKEAHADANRNAAEMADIAAKAAQAFEDSLEQANSAAGDVTGLDAYEQALKDADAEQVRMTANLNDFIEKQKATGNALDSAAIENHTRRISSAVKRMTDEAVRNLQNFRMEAMGLSGDLDAVSAAMLDAYDQREQFTQTQLDPLGTVAGGSSAAGNARSGRQYGADKASIAQGIIDAAGALGISPQVLATTISYETVGSFDPMKKGPVTEQWGQHRGLIQFGVPQARENGVDFSSREAAVASQVGADGAIVSYLRRAGVKPGMGLLQVYSAINAGGIGEKYYNRSDAQNGGAPGTVRDKVNYQMEGHKDNAASLLALAPGYSPNAPAATPSTTPTTDARRIAASTFDQMATNLSGVAKATARQAVIDNPELMQSLDFKVAINEGDIDAIGEQIRSVGDVVRADEFMRTSQGTLAVNQAQADVEAAKTLKDAVDKISFGFDDVKTPSLQAQSVDRETADLLKELTKDGASLTKVTGTATTAQAEARVRELVQARSMVELERELQEIRTGGVEVDSKRLRDAEQRVDLQRIENEQGEQARAREEIRLRLLNEDQDNGYSRSDADRKAIEDSEMRAWDAENSQRLADKRKTDAEKALSDAEQIHTDKIATFQARLAQLNEQLAAATQSQDTALQGSLRDSIREVSAELVTATDAASTFYDTISGPKGEQGRIQMERLRFETEQNVASMGKMSPEVQGIADVITNSLVGAVQSFSKNVADGMKPWDALKQSVKQAVGQILMDIGMMIIKAVIAKMVLNALGMGGMLAGPAQSLGSMTVMPSTPGVQLHSGGTPKDGKNIDFLAGVLNLKPNEVPAILEDDEEVLTRSNPRHRDNMGRSIARIQDFRNRSNAGPTSESIAASQAAGGVAGRAMTSAIQSAPAPQVNLTNVNAFDDDDLRNRMMGGAAGTRMLLNQVAKNKSAIKGALS